MAFLEFKTFPPHILSFFYVKSAYKVTFESSKKFTYYSPALEALFDPTLLSLIFLFISFFFFSTSRGLWLWCFNVSWWLFFLILIILVITTTTTIILVFTPILMMITSQKVHTFQASLEAVLAQLCDAEFAQVCNQPPRRDEDDNHDHDHCYHLQNGHDLKENR